MFITLGLSLMVPADFEDPELESLGRQIEELVRERVAPEYRGFHIHGVTKVQPAPGGRM